MDSFHNSAIRLRWATFAAALGTTLFSAWLFSVQARAEGWTEVEILRLALSSLCVFWLSWGAAGAVLGAAKNGPPATAPRSESGGRTAILMPIYHEDPPSTFARAAAMSRQLAAASAHGGFDLFILSDSQAPDAAAREALWFETLLGECAVPEQIYYRRRTRNVARKAGNIEDFIRRSGGAYDYALILDADSLMDAETMLEMVRRLDADPRLGLLQTLPTLVEARSIFGRALQFASHVYAPTYARGAAMLHGAEGPYWGHNAMFRIQAFAQSCGLPELSGKPPFGGHILSHDYVEAALLARNGWRVRLDTDLGGSYEEGPETIIDYAKRDQRWCQGNLQHARVVVAPGLRFWSRVTLLQGVLSYLMPALWLLLLGVGITATDLERRHYLRPGPAWAGWALMAFVFLMLVGPKVLAALTTPQPARRPLRVLALDMLAEITLSTVLAPVILMFQLRALMRVLSGRDGGWPPNNRTGGAVSLREAWHASWWICCAGGAGLALLLAAAPAVAPWALPVALPMLAAPLLIAWSSLPAPPGLWQVPPDLAPTPVLRDWHAVHRRWLGASRSAAAVPPPSGAADVIGQ